MSDPDSPTKLLRRTLSGRDKKPPKSPRSAHSIRKSMVPRLPSFHMPRRPSLARNPSLKTPREQPHALVLEGNQVMLENIVKVCGSGYLQELDEQSRTPLHIAAINGQFEILRYLLEVKPTILEAIDEDGWTALHHACMAGHLDAACYLIASGADFWAHTHKSDTVLNILLRNKTLVRPPRVRFVLSSNGLWSKGGEEQRPEGDRSDDPFQA